MSNRPLRDLETCVFLLAGASGFIAQAFIRAAEAAGGQVVGFDLKAVDGPPEVLLKGHTRIHIGNLESVGDAIERDIAERKPSAIVALNFAGIASAPLCEKMPGLAYEANVHFALRFAAFAQRVGASGLVFPSTGYVYGDSSTQAHTETSPVSVSSTYVNTKLAAEKLLEVLARASLKIAVARLSNVYGPGCAEGSVLGTVVKQATEAGIIQVESFLPTRDFVHVDDVAGGLLCMTAGEQEESFIVYNISSAIPLSIGDLVRKASSLWGVPYKEPAEPKNAHKASCLVLDNSKARDVLSWVPRVPIESGLLGMKNGE